ADGRYVVFNGGFAGDNSRQIWLRHRDPDENGIFDEAGATSTVIAQDWQLIGADQIFGAEDVAISSDGRMLAFTATTYEDPWGNVGTRLFVHDRQTSNTYRIDQPKPGFEDEYA